MTEQKKKMSKGKKWGIGIAIFLAVGFVGNLLEGDPTPEEVEAEAQEQTEKEEAQEQRDKERQEKKEAKAQEKEEEDAAKAKEKEEAEKKEEEKKEQQAMIENGLEQWEAEEDGLKDFLMNEHRENGLVDVGSNDDDFSVMNAFVSDEFRLLSDQEKEYLINEMGNSIRNLIGSNFGHLDKDNKSKVYVNFFYPNNEPAATQKMGGSWKIK